MLSQQKSSRYAIVAYLELFLLCDDFQSLTSIKGLSDGAYRFKRERQLLFQSPTSRTSHLDYIGYGVGPFLGTLWNRKLARYLVFRRAGESDWNGQSPFPYSDRQHVSNSPFPNRTDEFPGIRLSRESIFSHWE